MLFCGELLARNGTFNLNGKGPPSILVATAIPIRTHDNEWFTIEILSTGNLPSLNNLNTVAHSFNLPSSRKKEMAAGNICIISLKSSSSIDGNNI